MHAIVVNKRTFVLAAGAATRTVDVEQHGGGVRFLRVELIVAETVDSPCAAGEFMCCILFLFRQGSGYET